MRLSTHKKNGWEGYNSKKATARRSNTHSSSVSAMRMSNHPLPGSCTVALTQTQAGRYPLTYFVNTRRTVAGISVTR